MKKSNIHEFCIFLCVPALFLFSVVPGDTSAQTPAQAQGPWVKIAKKVNGCGKFKDVRVHPDRYFLASSTVVPYPPDMVYDLTTGSLTTINLRTLQGMPQEPKATGYEVSRLKLAGEYWHIYDLGLAYYDGDANIAGAYMTRKEVKMSVEGAPRCKKCGKVTELITQYSRYYCRSCKNYVDEKDYFKDVYLNYYVTVDPKAGSVKSMDFIAEGSYWKIGADAEGKNFYFYDTFPVYREPKTKDCIAVYRYNIASKSIDWKYTIQTPVRYRDKSSGTYMMHAFASDDFSKIMLWEYDEEYDIGSRRGWLKDPPAQGYIIDVAAKTHFAVDIPSTPYAHIFDRSGRFLLLASNQYGTLHRINIQEKNRTSPCPAR